VDSVWEQEKLEAMKMLDAKRAADRAREQSAATIAHSSARALGLSSVQRTLF